MRCGWFWITSRSTRRGGRRSCRLPARSAARRQTLNEWVKKAEVDSGKRAGVPTDVAEKLKALERENRELRQANEILRKASAYFAQAELDRRVEAMIAFIDDHRDVHGVEPICKVLPIAPSTYHAHAARRADPSPAPARATARCRPCGRDRARVRGELPGLRRAQGLAAAAARGHRRCPLHGRAPDARDGSARRDPRQAGAEPRSATRRRPVRSTASTGNSGRPRRTGCGSPTSPMSPPGRASSTSPSSSTPSPAASSAGGCRERRRPSFVLDALEQALHDRRPIRRGGLVHHSDRGANTSRSSTPSAWPRPASSRPSAASATATTTRWPRRSIGLYKAEVIHRRGPWRSFEAVEFATLEWVDWFNHRRLLEPIGNIPPAEAEDRYYAKLKQPAMAA